MWVFVKDKLYSVKARTDKLKTVIAQEVPRQSAAQVCRAVIHLDVVRLPMKKNVTKPIWSPFRKQSKKAPWLSYT